MTTQAEKSATSAMKELKTKLSDISQQTAEAVACCQLSSFAVEAAFDRLRTRLLAEQHRLRVYTALGGSLDSFTSPLDVSSFSITLTKLEEVHKSALQLEATLRRIIDHISQFPTLLSPSSDIAAAEEKPDDIFTVLDNETHILSQCFLSFSRAFHAFWKERLMLHTGPSTATISPSVVVARAAQKLVSSVDLILTSSFEKYCAGSYASSGDACLQIISSVDSTTNGVVAEMLAWFTSRGAAPIAQEVFELICEYLWCSRLISDLAEVRAELDPARLPVTTAAGVVSALLQTQIVRSRVCSHLVVPIGATGSGKDSLINALIGSTVLPPNGEQTFFPCRIRHQRGLTEPILTTPYRAFLAALNCLRRAQLRKRRAAFDAMKDRSLVDPATRGLIEKFGELDKPALKWVDELESTGYDIPETVKGVVSIRQLLADLNTLGRAYHTLGIPLNLSCVEWPTVNVDFRSLHASPDSWEFWSVPGEYDTGTLPGNIEYFNRTIEYHANVLPVVNYQQREVDAKWIDFPSRLRSAQAAMPCVLGTFAEHLESEGLLEFRTELGREFFNDPNSPRILICNLHRGSEATAFLANSDPDSFESLGLAQSEVQQLYDATPSSAIEEMATREMLPDEALQKLVQWVPQCTRQSIIKSMHLVVTRCSELEKEIDAVLESKILSALRQREQEMKIGALLVNIRVITEANLEDAREILQEFHDRFARRIAEEVHVSILHCVETVPPVPNQITVERLEFLFSEIELAQLMGRIDERLQAALDDLSQELVQVLGSALEPLMTRELAALPTDQATVFGILVAPFHERFHLVSKKLPKVPPTPTLDEIKQHCDIFRPKSSKQALFEDCRCKLPLIGKRRHHRILSPLTAFLAILPFLARWSELLRDSPPSYRVDVPRLEQFYRDNLTTPWHDELRKMIDSSIENAVKEAWRAVEETRSKVNADTEQDYLRLLLVAKGSLHFAVAMLPHLLGDAEAQ